MPRPCWRFNGRDAPVRGEPPVWWTGRRAKREQRLQRMIAACAGDEKRARGLVRDLQDGFRVCNTEAAGLCAQAEALVRECVASHKARVWHGRPGRGPAGRWAQATSVHLVDIRRRRPASLPGPDSHGGRNGHTVVRHGLPCARRRTQRNTAYEERMTEHTADPDDYPNHEGVAILGELADCAHARWEGRWPEILDEAEHAHFWYVRDTYDRRGAENLPMAFLAASLARAARPAEYAPAIPSTDPVIHGVSAPLRMLDAVGRCDGAVAIDTNLRLLRLKAALIAGDVQMCSADMRASIAPYVRLIRGLAKAVLIVASAGPGKAAAVSAGYTLCAPHSSPPAWETEGAETYMDPRIAPAEVRSWFIACGGRLASLVLRGETSFASVLEMVYGDRLNRARVVTGGYYYRLLGVVGSNITALPRKYWKDDDDDD